MTNLKVFILSFVLVFAIGLIALAQETPSAEETTGVGGGYSPIITAEEAVNLDENVQPEDLEVKDPKLLPDSPFYFLKDWVRGIRSTFTFNKVKKAELENKFANEKLIELKKLTEKGASPEAIQKATENYKKATEKVKEKVDKIEEKAAESEGVDNFLDKFVKQQILQEKILQKLETQVPAEAFAKIKEAREKHLEKFGEVMTKLEDRSEKIKEKVENTLNQQEGSQFKNFKNLEILKNIEEKIPEQAKEAIQQAQENALKRLQGDLEKMSPEDQEKFKEYIEGISGDKEKQLEILENVRSEVQEKVELKETLKEAREKILEKVKIEPLPTITCPAIEKPSSDFCEKGRIVVKKDEKGCVVAFKCVIPGEIEIPPENGSIEKPGYCYALWDPVCGKNGKTYSNKCFAGLAGIDVDYKGECKEKQCQTDADCPQLRCGATVATARCVGMVNKCIEGKCTTTTTESKETNQ